MKQSAFFALIFTIFALSACSQPDVQIEYVDREVVVEVEVTRIVEVEVEKEVIKEVIIEATPVAALIEQPQVVFPSEVTLEGNEFESADLELLIETWTALERNFDGDLPDAETVTNAIISAAVETADDDYTFFSSPEVAQMNRDAMRGDFEGIGAFVDTTDEGFFIIVRPMDGFPADLAGIRSDDIVTHVDGEEITGWSTDEVVNIVRGPRGEPVTLTIVREDVDDPFDITVVRDRIVVPVIRTEMLDNKIGYVHLTSFNQEANSQTAIAIQDLIDQDMEGLIFDLRDNPGGFLTQSIDVADIFLPDGIVLFERNNKGLDNTFFSKDGGLAETIPLVVLINEGSASASEIVAGAIQDRGRAPIIGTVSFGKGSVQQLIPMSNQSELRVTIAKWYTPNETSLNEGGIVPDIEIETPEDLGGEEDGQLQAAIEYLLENR